MSNKLLIIGVDKYKFHTELATCVKDVTDFRNILLEKYDFDEGDIYELLNEKATNKNIQDALSGYGKILNNNDNLIIFFSGHGSYSRSEERGFWIPFDGTKEYTTWIPNETIIAYLNRIQSKHIFVISDSCFSNSLLLHDSAKSLNDYNNRPSRWALTSAFDESYSPKDSNTNSLFAESIIKFLEESDADFRISQMIEYVKTCFLNNVLQTPQGSPIKVSGHKGGELILTIKDEIDNRALKGYKDFKKVLGHYKRNAKFEEVAVYEDRTIRVGFQLFKELDPIVKRANYYLYLYSGIVQTQTYKYLKENYPQIFTNLNLIIFLPKEQNQKDLEKRKNNIKSKFKPVNIFYIDEFIRTACTPVNNDSEPNSLFLQISNFILPSYYNSSNSDINVLIDKWQYSLSEPILVIKGSGGIGKTTFAQYIVDKITSNSPFATVLFIDSVKIKDNLIRRNRNIEQLSIYNFYEALFNQDEPLENKLSEDIFRLNLDAGNIILVIDGLDEVISKIPNFSTEAFLKSISETSNELGGGKVIITCRTHFWPQIVNERTNFEIIELRPFDKKQAKEFFSKSLDSDKKRSKALKLADEFKFTDNDNENAYHPYVLDIIRSILELSDDTVELDLTEFSSSILNPKIKNDYIIYRVCDRERKRIGQINIDDQLKFFIYLAIERRSIVYLSNFKKEIETALGKNIDNINIEAFKSHPFLVKNTNSISFRYDFFADIFKGIYVASYFNSNNSEIVLTNAFVEIISESCWLDSGLNYEIVRRIKDWTELELLFISELIEKVVSDDFINKEKKREIIANIFNIVLLINHKRNSNDIEANTTLLRSIFEKRKSVIENLCIINLNTDKHVRFNFSGLQIIEAYINGYNSFYDCSFNNETKFINSYILNVESGRNINKIPDYIFKDCFYDKNVADAIDDFKNTKKNNTDKAKSFINSFFHLFYSNGKLGRQWEEKVIMPRFKGVDKYNYGYKNVMKILKNNDVILSAVEMEGIKLFVNDKYKSDVVRFVKDGTISPIIAKLIKDFSEN